MIYDCEHSELLKVLSQDEIDFISNLRIPYGSHPALWAKKYLIDERVCEAKIRGEIKEIERAPVKQTRAAYVISDYVPGGEIKSMADGKTYDSKSKYYQSVKDAGLVVVGNDKITQKRETDTVTERDVKHAIDRLKSR